MTIRTGKGQVRLRGVLAGLVAVAGMAMIAPGTAAAGSVDCSGKVVPATDSTHGKAYGFTFLCASPEGDATTVDGFSIISNKDISSFSTEVTVTDPAGTALNTESFGCEGPFPSDGFGCFGKASQYNTIHGGFSLIRNPCSNKQLRKGAWHVWVVASAAKVNPLTGKKTPAVTEPLRLRVPGCSTDASPSGATS
ncbi:MAG: hypothetical protein ABIZ50_05895 [Solirubrobacterales bacterium]